MEEGDDNSDEDEAVVEEAEVEVEGAEVDGADEGQGVHNERVCKTLKDKAIKIMRLKTPSVVINPDEERIALQIFPRVSRLPFLSLLAPSLIPGSQVAGLARRVNDIADTQQRFVELVERDPEVQGTQRTLSRRVPTRWNSDLHCLLAHFYFQDVVDELTSSPAAKLTAFHLTDDQWRIAEEVKEVLLVCQFTI